MLARRKLFAPVPVTPLVTGGNSFTPCKHCEAVGRTATHRHNRSYFNPRKNKDIEGWVKRLREEKLVPFNDELHVGTAKTVVLKHPNKEQIMYEASLSCSLTRNTYIPKLSEENKDSLLPKHTGIVDSGVTHLYIAPNAPHVPLGKSATRIRVGTANGQVSTSAAKATLPIPQLAADFPTTGYSIPTITNTLIVIGPICDANFTVVFKKQDVTVISPEGKPILQGWREKKLPRLWNFALKPNNKGEQKYTTTNQKIPEAHSVYDLPNLEALVRYMHAVAGFPLKSTWLKAI